ncbi:LacI family transcriptional regulator [Serinibacter arcticus]|uniref:LacI family transcriptional regulator n=1 Tax=Serinibacter arcticus TaxID=1655435 RepID=A0A2U1ZU99_9MICO|nr:LacI family DNA-binding transcriptional regulator [Serinibacter arcticus]PWD50502.1 LacI family transcriptional regulator [Serinibacter arcticus]
MTRNGRATLSDVARLAGVSASTASLTFSGSGPVSLATRERVLAAAAELGYSGPDPLARSLRRGESGVVGVITNELASSFRDPVALRTLDGLADALGAHDLGMLLIRATDEGEGADLIRRAAMDAAVFLRPLGPHEGVVELLRGRGIAVVLLESIAEGAASVKIADADGMAELAARVRDLGHTRVAVVSLPWAPGVPPGLREDTEPDPDSFPFTLARLTGIRSAGVVPTQIYVSAGSLVEEGFEAAKVLLAQPERPTAIMACSDLLAAGVLLAARELGLAVPGDLSITGFDGVDLPWLAPDVIDSVEQPASRKGQLGGEAAVAMMAGGEPTSIELEVWQRPGTTLGPVPQEV